MAPLKAVIKMPKRNCDRVEQSKVCDTMGHSYEAYEI